MELLPYNKCPPKVVNARFFIFCAKSFRLQLSFSATHVFSKKYQIRLIFSENTSRTTCISHFPFLQNHNKDFQLSDPVICWSWQLQIWSNLFHTLTHLQFYLQYLPPKNVCKILKQIRKKNLSTVVWSRIRWSWRRQAELPQFVQGGWERVQAISLEGNIFSSGSENRTQG